MCRFGASCSLLILFLQDSQGRGYDIADEIVALFTGGHYWFLYDLLLVMITTRLFRSFKGD